MVEKKSRKDRKGLRRTDYIQAAIEMNKKMGLHDPPIDTAKNTPLGEVRAGIIEGAGLLEEDDERSLLSESTWEVIEKLGMWTPQKEIKNIDVEDYADLEIGTKLTRQDSVVLAIKELCKDGSAVPFSEIKKLAAYYYNGKEDDHSSWLVIMSLASWGCIEKVGRSYIIPEKYLELVKEEYNEE
jgi:hypothetical protein